MNPVTKTVRIDLAHPGGMDFLSRVYAVQGDAYSRLVAFELYSNGEKYTPPEGTTAIVRYRKDDGTGGNYEVLPDGSAAYTINGNMLTVTLDPQVCIVPGLVQLAVGLILGNAEINTFSVRVVVQPNPGLEYQSESHVKLAGTVADSGWEPNMYLGTDDGGNVTGLSTDKTLNQPGRAADAKATGDAIQTVTDKLASEISRAEIAAGAAQDAQTAAAGSAQRAKTEAENARTAAQQACEAAARAEEYAPKDGTVLSVNGKGGAVQLGAQDVAAVPLPAQSLPGEVVRILSVDTATGAVQTDTTPLPDLRPYVRSETVPTAATPGAVRADGQYGVAVRTDATLTTVPATASQLDRMTEAYAPLTPALLPYGVKKALTSAAGAANWSAQEKTAALLQLGADDRFYSKAEADRKFSTGYTLPCATADVLGGVKVGSGLSVTDDGTLSSDAQGYTLPAATATTLGGVKVGDYLDIAADGTLSGKTLNDKIAAAVAVKSEPRLVWNHHTQSPTKWNTYDVSIPDGVDYVHIKTKCNNYTGAEFDLARGGNTSHVFDKVSANVVCTMTFRADGTLHVQGPYSDSNYGHAIELWLSGYHYPTLAELLTETQAAQADTDAMAVDHEYRVAMLELGMTDDTTTDTTT